ncbi:zinc ribbon domain-containing protein [Bacillus thuringiensis]|nr:zinc ribbon domain-containing protein [Bacillus thuringiensis]
MCNRCCGDRKEMSLSERTYGCSCKLMMNRDYNAATSLLTLA